MENLGKLGRDKVTGFEGVIIATTYHLFGCETYHLVPKIKDGNMGAHQAFDKGRIIIIGEGINPSEVQTEKPGGVDLNLPDNRVFSNFAML